MMNLDLEDIACEEGRRARCSGIPVDKNPYDVITAFRHGWLVGWHSADREIGEDLFKEIKS